MDEATSQVISTLLTAILGTGGIATVIAAVKAWRTRAGTPTTEQQAVAHVGADWDALNKYWKAEVARIRKEQADERRGWAIDREKYRLAIRRMRRHIDRLENHIWMKLPPPPPVDTEEGNETL
jgi:hypothetical protein